MSTAAQRREGVLVISHHLVGWKEKREDEREQRENWIGQSRELKADVEDASPSRSSGSFR